MNLKSTIAVTCMLSVVGGSQAQSSEATPTTQPRLIVLFRSCDELNNPDTCTPIIDATLGVTNVGTGAHSEVTTSDSDGNYYFPVAAGTYEIDTVPGDAIDDSSIRCFVIGGPETTPVDYPVEIGNTWTTQCVYAIVQTNAKGNPAPTTPSKPAPTQVAVASLPNTGAGAAAGAEDSTNGSTDALALIGAATAVIAAAGVALKRRTSFGA
jgi:hypothetical protein